MWCAEVGITGMREIIAVANNSRCSNTLRLFLAAVYGQSRKMAFIVFSHSLDILVAFTRGGHGIMFIHLDQYICINKTWYYTYTLGSIHLYWYVMVLYLYISVDTFVLIRHGSIFLSWQPRWYMLEHPSRIVFHWLLGPPDLKWSPWNVLKSKNDLCDIDQSWLEVMIDITYAISIRYTSWSENFFTYLHYLQNLNLYSMYLL